MSLVKTLAKVAIGVAVAKGASTLMKGQRGQTGAQGASLFGGAHSPQRTTRGGGLEDMLGGLLGGGGAPGGNPMGGLGGLLEQLGGTQGGAGGLQDMLGKLAGGSGTTGGLGGLLGGLAGAMQGGGGSAPGGSFGSVLNSAFDQNETPQMQPAPEHEAMAGLILRAMIQATKADRELDAEEKEKIISQLGEDGVDSAEAQFVQEELRAPVDVNGLVSQVPQGMEQQVYAVSVLAIDLDNQAEAQYLHQLATGLGLKAQTVNAIHDQLGAPSLYT